MNPPLLPFEQAFREWLDANSMSWERLSIPSGAAGESTAAYRFAPAGTAQRIALTLHGAGNDALFAWVGLFKRLLLSGTEIFTFDLPGHGRSNRTDFGRETAIRAVHSALDECCAERRDLSVHAVAVSLGASVLLCTLPELQERLASAALIVAPLQIVLTPRSFLGEIGSRTLRLVWREREHYGLTGLIPSFGPFKRDVYPLRLGGEVPRGLFGYVTALNQVLDEMRLENAAAAVRLPVLLVYGCRDRIVPVEQGISLARLLPSAELLTIPEGTHLSTPLEDAATERLLRWIEDHG